MVHESFLLHFTSLYKYTLRHCLKLRPFLNFKPSFSFFPRTLLMIIKFRWYLRRNNFFSMPTLLRLSFNRVTVLEDIISVLNLSGLRNWFSLLILIVAMVQKDTRALGEKKLQVHAGSSARSIKLPIVINK